MEKKNKDLLRLGSHSRLTTNKVIRKNARHSLDCHCRYTDEARISTSRTLLLYPRGKFPVKTSGVSMYPLLYCNERCSLPCRRVGDLKHICTTPDAHQSSTNRVRVPSFDRLPLRWSKTTPATKHAHSLGPDFSLTLNG